MFIPKITQRMSRVISGRLPRTATPKTSSPPRRCWPPHLDTGIPFSLICLFKIQIAVFLVVLLVIGKIHGTLAEDRSA